uniref:CopG family transcriptional regulator n=2 Tax=cellular organisms TaxID=131567 RepID=A0A7C4RXQ9_FERPE
MKVVTVHLPTSVLEEVKKLVDAGVFFTKNEAIRYLIVSRLIGFKGNGLKMLNKIFTIDSNKYSSKNMTLVSLKVPTALLSYMDAVIESLGFSSRSEFIRTAILKFIENLSVNAEEE